MSRYERSLDRRERASALRRAGKRNREIAVEMGVTPQAVSLWFKEPLKPPRSAYSRPPNAWLDDLRVDLDAALRLIESGHWAGAAAVVRADIAMLDQRFGPR